MAPPLISVYPPLNPRVLARRSARQLPFPLDDPRCRLYMEARQGLWAGLKGLGITDGDEVLAPAYHHGSDIEALVRAGARCRFYDSNETFEPDEGELESLLGPRVRALYLIHPLGFAQDCSRWRRWCDERGLLLLEDGAQAWLSARDGQPVGADADLALFCLYKVFGLPDGGAVCSRAFAGPCPDAESTGVRALAGRLAGWTAQRSRSAATVLERVTKNDDRAELPEVEFALIAVDEKPGRTTRMLLSRVVDLDAPARRRAHFARLGEALGELRSPAFADMPAGSSPLAFPIEVGDKPATVERLARSGIAHSGGWRVPHPVMDPAAFPGAAGLRSRLIALPVHQELRELDVERVAKAARRAVSIGYSQRVSLAGAVVTQ
jgi:dTDP-4-amino-4,6-dideoxygalactose transaminase